MKKSALLCLLMSVTLLAQAPAVNVSGGLNVMGNVAVSGEVSALGAIKTNTAFVFPDGTTLADLSNYKTKVLTYLAGCDSCALLSDLADDKMIFLNQYPQDYKLLSVTCVTDIGVVTINLTRDDGTPANMLSANLACAAAGATTTAFVMGEDVLKPGDKLGFVIVTTGGTAHRVMLSVKATL